MSFLVFPSVCYLGCVLLFVIRVICKICLVFVGSFVLLLCLCLSCFICCCFFVVWFGAGFF